VIAEVNWNASGSRLLLNGETGGSIYCGMMVPKINQQLLGKPAQKLNMSEEDRFIRAC
jgi:hypothetical protein